jgi:D-alanyl-D-alanine carboxypeptidase
VHPVSATRLVQVALVAALGGLTGLTGLLAAPAAQALGPSVLANSAPGAAQNSPGGGEQQPSLDEVAAQQRRAESLRTAVDARAGEVAQARAELERAARTAALALEQYTSAVLAARTAQFEADRQDQLLVQAQLTQAGEKALLGRWARQAYGQGEIALNPALGTILEGGSTDDLGRALTYLQRAGDARARGLHKYEQAAQRQAEIAGAAEVGRVRARTSSELATRARESAEAAVSVQQDRVNALEALLSSAQDAAAAADTRASNLARARALAQARTAAQARRVAQGRAGGHGLNIVTGQTGDCRGGDISVYDNGRIPLEVLCPLWGTADEHLRADAAYAFNRLSQAYAQRFGEPICVTDSYRDYDTQVRLYAEKPNLAAVPGTSNHGWGTATDLCGGVQNFGTATHRWLLTNAPLYGWFHPAWAEPNGSRPEPWHWEFAG